VAELDALERDLFALAAQVEWPPTPRLAPAVRLRLQPRRLLSRRLVLALVAAAVAAALAAGAVAAGFVHVPGINIQRTSRPPATPTPSAPLSPLGTRLDLGAEQASVAAAQAAAGFPVAVPATLGEPDLVFFRPTPVPVVTLVYHPRPDLPAGKDPEVGALVMEFRASASGADYVQKMAGPDTKIEQVTVNGAPGVWLEGAPHAVFVVPSPAGRDIVSDNIRLAGNTLLWYRNGVTYRLEAQVTKERALQIAGTVR
jgi:hypothetical protein